MNISTHVQSARQSTSPPAAPYFADLRPLVGDVRFLKTKNPSSTLKNEKMLKTYFHWIVYDSLQNALRSPIISVQQGLRTLELCVDKNALTGIIIAPAARDLYRGVIPFLYMIGCDGDYDDRPSSTIANK
ncbi:hypothetical protein L596_000800 [Steinernema carpocapsae]|uniref:Uncharacterized protein n=1 Tax=Steinernema carpocapsae TaxID=34508 RepID=A0A4U8UJT8_STECR|nr:hypothetical protein L596_000800 [Steinernema carpocapsae]